MSRYEDVLVDGPSSLAELRRVIANITGDATPDADGEMLVYCWTEGLFLDVVDHADLENASGMPLSEFRFIISVRAWAGTDAQVTAARALYEILDRRTGYRLLLAFNDSQEFGATRPALASV